MSGATAYHTADRDPSNVRLAPLCYRHDYRKERPDELETTFCPDPGRCDDPAET